MTEIEIPKLQKLVQTLTRYAVNGLLHDTKSQKAMQTAVDAVAKEQRTLVPKWRRRVHGAIKTEVKRDGKDLVGRAGPGVGGAPKHAGPLEAGVPAGRVFPPYGPGSDLMAWTVARGFPPQAARIIARNIYVRGLPTKANPRTPNDPPVYVVRGYEQAKPAVEKALHGMAFDVVDQLGREIGK